MRNTAAALPDAHPDVSLVNHLGELYVGPVGEHRGVLEQWSSLCHRRGFCIGNEEDEMGIAYIHGSSAETLPAGEEVSKDPVSAVSVGKVDFERNALAHLHVYVEKLSFLVETQTQHLDAGECLEPEFVLVGQPIVVDVASDTARTVAAHKVAQNPDVFTEVMIASRTKSKCDALVKAIGNPNIKTAKVDADNVDELVALFNDFKPEIVMNLALPYQDLLQPTPSLLHSVQ